jgi:hypothetical protein
MMQTHALWLQLRRWLLMLVALTPSAACSRSEDCKLFGTCTNSLLERAEEMAEQLGAEATTCRKCLNERCQATALSCSLNFECNFTSRCRLTTSPSAYQACMRDLYEGGLTFGRETRFPWEGEENASTFGRCLHEHCRSACVGDSFACGETYGEYDELRAKVAVREYPGYDPVKRVRLRVCFDSDLPEATLDERWRSCTDWEKTDDDGIASFTDEHDEVLKNVPVERLYFEIEAQEGLFPKTFYYPGRLGEEGLQLLAIYVVNLQLIAAGNSALQRGYKVLEDAAQSLILSDSCVWETIAAPDLRVEIDNNLVEQCYERKELCDETACPPCVWYAANQFPDPLARRTDGSGAGVVGLPPAFYTIRVKRADDDGDDDNDEPVSLRRRIRMEKGAMTVVRTWPLPEREREPARTPDAGAP